jgi:Plasmid encoded RepA protein
VALRVAGRSAPSRTSWGDSRQLVRLALNRDGRAIQIDTKVVTGFDLWFPKDECQHVLWPSQVRLSHEYFESLRKHAVPLDERALAALAHSAMALNVYSWLAQRLHRVHPFQPQFIPWTAVKAQFGFSYGRMNNFKSKYRIVLQAVLSQYRAARVELDDCGMTLRYSPPPVKGRIAITAPPRKPETHAGQLPTPPKPSG